MPKPAALKWVWQHLSHVPSSPNDCELELSRSQGRDGSWAAGALFAKGISHPRGPQGAKSKLSCAFLPLTADTHGAQTEPDRGVGGGSWPPRCHLRPGELQQPPGPAARNTGDGKQQPRVSLSPKAPAAAVVQARLRPIEGLFTGGAISCRTCPSQLAGEQPGRKAQQQLPEHLPQGRAMNKSLGSKARLPGETKTQALHCSVTERSSRDRQAPQKVSPVPPTLGPSPLSFIPTKRTRQGPSLSCTALESDSSSTGLGCHGNSLQSSSFSTSTRPCRVITSPCGSSTMSVGMPARESELGQRPRQEGSAPTQSSPAAPGQGTGSGLKEESFGMEGQPLNRTLLGLRIPSPRSPGPGPSPLGCVVGILPLPPYSTM